MRLIFRKKFLVSRNDVFEKVRIVKLGKKIGILTHYFGSTNYGGNLQAYAFCRILIEKFDMSAEQVCYDNNGFRNPDLWGRIRNMRLRNIVRRVMGPVRRKYAHRKHPVLYNKIEEHNKAVLDFNKSMIPHSKEVYNKRTIKRANSQYEVFITGSDQVWYPYALCPAYTLKFVDSDKIKFSYAASMSTDSLSVEHKNLLKTSLSSYTGVSVREESSKEILKDLSSIEVQRVLDPTLLLTRQEWDQVVPDREIKESYIFGFLLGEDREQRNFFEEFAKKKELPLVIIPFKEVDEDFGDIQLSKVSPLQFVSLIKHAEFILTDSFHATVFSSLYHKEFFAFERLTHTQLGTMGSRLLTLTAMFHQEERFCNSVERMNIEYLENIIQTHKPFADSEVEEMRIKSFSFLAENLKPILHKR